MNARFHLKPVRQAADPTVAALVRLLVPERDDITSMAELVGAARHKLDRLPGDQRRRFRALIALAAADLHRRQSDLERQRQEVRERLAALNRHRDAAVQYSRLARGYGQSRQPLVRGRV